VTRSKSSISGNLRNQRNLRQRTLLRTLTHIHPAFDVIRPLLNRIDHSHLIVSLNSLARERKVDLTFVAAPEKKVSAVEYETRIVAARELIVNNSLHDLFNACIWLMFPKTKRIISELHVGLGSGENNRRPRRRDVLTLFDESGLMLICDPPHCDGFKQLNETHQWKTLFAERRNDFVQHVRPILFGHGALEQLASNWHRGLTVKAQWLALHRETSLAEIDTFLSSKIRANEELRDNERRIPMPLVGIPGWFAENDDTACYDDVSVFRPARRR
jgi:hypothetical protein